MASDETRRTRSPSWLAAVGGLLVGAWLFLWISLLTRSALSDSSYISSDLVDYAAVGLGLIFGVAAAYWTAERLSVSKATYTYLLVSTSVVLTAVAVVLVYSSLSLREASVKLSTARPWPELPYPQFPWPPPVASERLVLPSRFFPAPPNHLQLLNDIDFKLTTALDSAGYLQRSYYAVPDGFALVTRLEQINSDGTPKNGDQRWLTENEPLQSFSLTEYLTRLFTAKPGFYRVIAFIITLHEFAQSDATVSVQQAEYWLASGMNKLPLPIGNMVYTRQYACTALIFEFQQAAAGQKAKLDVPSRLAAQVHLARANIWPALER